MVEAALAHTIKDKAEAAYARSDLLEKRRPLMDAWAEHCVRPLAPVPGFGARHAAVKGPLGPANGTALMLPWGPWGRPEVAPVRGHRHICVPGVHSVEVKTSLRAGAPSAVGRTGSGVRTTTQSIPPEPETMPDSIPKLR